MRFSQRITILVFTPLENILRAIVKLSRILRRRDIILRLIFLTGFILLIQVSSVKLFAKSYPFTNTDRDPFSPLVTKSGQILLQKKTGVKSYVLKGIIYSDGSSIAVIGDELYKRNEHIGEYTIAKIGKKKVILKKGKEIVILKLEEK